MGEVYRARDTRLGRDVALKMLPSQFAADADRLHRFEQEARAVAALNHPNILAVFDIGQCNGCPFLVSELLEGETLRTTLDRGALPQRKAIEYGVQVAQGLAAAHEKGIVHRDLKPENVFVTKDGRIKLLDFGLAKLAQKTGGASPDLDGVTLTHSNTTAGVVMGTASYMSPEQVRGHAIDPRTDIFAFGAVLYEMLSGTRAFRRDTSPETMTAVLKEDPPEFSNSARPVSPAVDRIVRRCLEKSPEQRFQSARDLSFALSALTGTDASAAIQEVAPVGRGPRSLFWIGLALALAAVSCLTWFLARQSPDKTRMQFEIPLPGEVSQVALSRDGKMLAFVSPNENTGLPQIFIQRVGAPNANALQGTEGASYPFWSPDDEYLGFFANGNMQKVAVAGGMPQIIVKVLAARGGSWSKDNVILYSPDSGGPIWRVNLDGTNAKPLTDLSGQPTIQTHRFPIFLPDGRHFLYLAATFANYMQDPVSGIYYGSIDGTPGRLLVACLSSFSFDGKRLYYANADGQLVASDFDSSNGTITGALQTVASIVGRSPSTQWTDVAAAENGTLLYYNNAGGSLSVLTWVDRTGKELGRFGVPHVMANPTISPDGSRIALDVSNPREYTVDIWIESVKGEGSKRITFNPSEDVTPMWSRNGDFVAYRSSAPVQGLLVKAASGLEKERRVGQFPSADDMLANSWAPDDKKILATQYDSAGSHLVLVESDGSSQAAYLQGQGSQAYGMISPDGKWVAYDSNELGSWEVYVSTFPAGQGKWQISRGGGTEPRWRGDSKEIYYVDPKGVLMSVPILGGTEFSAGTPSPLFQVHARPQISSTDIFTYDVAKDGQKFLVNRYVKPDHVAPLIIVLNADDDSKN